MNLISKIRSIKDYPKQGIMFRDITTLLSDADAVRYCAETIASKYKDTKIDKVLIVESRGFVIGSIVAYLLGAGIVLIRKKGKLPYKTLSEKYALEYGYDELEIHTDNIEPNEKIIIHDDLLATGGTICSAINLAKLCKAEIVGVNFIIELTFLNGREKIKNCSVENILSLVQYENES